MDRRTKQIGAVLCLMAMAFFAGWPFWTWLDAKAVSADIAQKNGDAGGEEPAAKAGMGCCLARRRADLAGSKGDR